MPKGKKRASKAAKKPRARPAGSKRGLAALHRQLGYLGPAVDEKAAPVRGRTLDAAASTKGSGEPLTPDRLDELEAEFRKDPKGVLAVVRKSLGYPMSAFELRRLLARARHATEEPAAYTRMLRRRSALLGPCPPPADIPADPDIPITPCDTRFDGLNDLDGWIFNCGPYWLKQKLRKLPREKFVAHSAASPFIYEMKDQQGGVLGPNDTIRVALFSDFGTGQYHSRYIAKHIYAAAPHYAIHLGDVYYAGTLPEVEQHLAKPLRPILDRSRVFAMNANHEMLSGGFGYFKYLRDKRNAGARVEQEQEGSYFCLRSPRYQVVALDTAYDYPNDGELTDPQQKAWLAQVLMQGKRDGRTSILLTQHEPFGLGERRENALFRQVRDCATQDDAWLIDYWFWGDEHYCVLYEASARVPFVGSCIGHAGHPVDLRDVNRRIDVARVFAKEKWVDVSPRFKRIREEELGNAGYCTLELGPNGVKFEYRDWLDNPIHP